MTMDSVGVLSLALRWTAEGAREVAPSASCPPLIHRNLGTARADVRRKMRKSGMMLCGQHFRTTGVLRLILTGHKD